MINSAVSIFFFILEWAFVVPAALVAYLILRFVWELVQEEKEAPVAVNKDAPPSDLDESSVSDKAAALSFRIGAAVRVENKEGGWVATASSMGVEARAETPEKAVYDLEEKVSE